MAGWWARFGTVTWGLVENLANWEGFSLIGEDIFRAGDGDDLCAWRIEPDLTLDDREWYNGRVSARESVSWRRESFRPSMKDLWLLDLVTTFWGATAP